jgi:hypothetical protein
MEGTHPRRMRRAVALVGVKEREADEAESGE